MNNPSLLVVVLAVISLACVPLPDERTNGEDLPTLSVVAQCTNLRSTGRLFVVGGRLYSLSLADSGLEVGVVEGNEIRVLGLHRWGADTEVSSYGTVAGFVRGGVPHVVVPWVARVSGERQGFRSSLVEFRLDDGTSRELWGSDEPGLYDTRVIALEGGTGFVLGGGMEAHFLDENGVELANVETGQTQDLAVWRDRLWFDDGAVLASRRLRGGSKITLPESDVPSFVLMRSGAYAVEASPKGLLGAGAGAVVLIHARSENGTTWLELDAAKGGPRLVQVGARVAAYRTSDRSLFVFFGEDSPRRLRVEGMDHARQLIPATTGDRVWFDTGTGYCTVELDEE